LARDKRLFLAFFVMHGDLGNGLAAIAQKANNRLN